MANVLEANRPADGGHPIHEWNGWADPFFDDALSVIGEVINHIDVTSCAGILKVMMAYLLLWSGVERFLAFRYGLGLKQARSNREALAGEKASVLRLTEC